MKIDVKDLTLQYGENVIQKGISFTVKQGEIFAIMGASGCGKSTLLKAMIGLLPVKKGSVSYDDEPFIPAEEQEQMNLLKRFGVLYQQGALWTSMTIGENVALPLQYHKSYSQREIDSIVKYKLSLVGMGGFENYFPSQISGGMRKRAALARAMALDPEVLFFDEPQAGLDPITSSRLDALIRQIRDGLGTTVVMVTHELASLFAIADRAIFLDAVEKQPTAIGDPREMRNSPPNEAVGEFLKREYQPDL